MKMSTKSGKYVGECKRLCIFSSLISLINMTLNIITLLLGLWCIWRCSRITALRWGRINGNLLLWGYFPRHYSHCTDEETGVGRWSAFPVVIQLMKAVDARVCVSPGSQGKRCPRREIAESGFHTCSASRSWICDAWQFPECLSSSWYAH